MACTSKCGWAIRGCLPWSRPLLPWNMYVSGRWMCPGLEHVNLHQGKNVRVIMELGVYKRLVFKPTLFKWRPHTSNRMFQNVMQSCGSVPWPWTCQLYYVGPSNKLGIFCLLFTHSGWIWKFGWSCVVNIVHKNYCSSQKYSHETLFILVSFPIDSINKSIIIENTDTYSQCSYYWNQH